MEKKTEMQEQELDVTSGLHKQEHMHDNGKLHVHLHTHTHGSEEAHAHGTAHRHVHSEAEKKAVINRLSKAIGHMEAVKRMVERDEDCSEVLIQLAAVRSAINNTGKVVLKNHIDHCIVEAVEENDQEAIRKLNQAIDKFIK
ncbi:hypothetical protein CE91St64_39340 [Faecalicatena contorta]|nr:hypothetical protein CE91St64_39340 [Faecalicatena contorta]